jgi:hypothetical protein
MEKNFTNTQFKWTFESISDNIPTIMLLTIVLTYGINAYLTAIFLPINFWIAITASTILQLGRFAVVFMDFLNPTKGRSPFPPKIALGATVIALIEVFFGLMEKYSGAEFITMFFFVGTIVCFGYLLEINFVNKGVEAYGLTEPKVIKRRKRRVVVKKVTEDAPKESKGYVTSFQTITL